MGVDLWIGIHIRDIIVHNRHFGSDNFDRPSDALGISWSVESQREPARLGVGCFPTFALRSNISCLLLLGNEGVENTWTMPYSWRLCRGYSRDPFLST